MINGRKVVGAVPIAELRAMIDESLAAATPCPRVVASTADG